MLGEVFHLDRIEATQTTVYGDEREVDATNLHALHQLTAEVQTRGRSGDGTLMLGIDSLEVLHIVSCSRTLVDDVAWQRR